MAGLFALPIAYWRFKVQQKQEAEAQQIARQYEADLKRYGKAQKSKQGPLVRHDSLFEDSDDEKSSFEVEKIEDIDAEDEQDAVPEKQRHISFRYTPLTDKTTFSQRQLWSIQL